MNDEEFTLMQREVDANIGRKLRTLRNIVAEEKPILQWIELDERITKLYVAIAEVNKRLTALESGRIRAIHTDPREVEQVVKKITRMVIDNWSSSKTVIKQAKDSAKKRGSKLKGGIK